MAFPEYHEEVRESERVLVCDDCSKVRYAGDWPACPHVPGLFGEEPIEAYVDEHLLENPVLITSRGQRRAIMNREGLEYRKKRFDLLTGQKSYFDMGGRK